VIGSADAIKRLDPFGPRPSAVAAHAGERPVSGRWRLRNRATARERGLQRTAA
jgi:hypothetical protein